VPGFRKILLKPSDSAAEAAPLFGTGGVEVLNRISDAEYDQLLAASIVFLNVYEGVAITTVMECIARGTPILINKLPGLVEYLGENYPLYYNTLTEAATKMRDLQLLQRTSAYLQNLETRRNITYEVFLRRVVNSAIYRSLPLPNSENPRFRSFEVSVMLCCHSRIQELSGLLERFTLQDFRGDFELILWNNNMAYAEEVARIIDPYRGKLNLKLIHSSENYYCIVRFAAASLMRSQLLLICDDDVLPERGYITRFLSKYKEYGPDAILCARGHVFLPHELDEAAPDRVWQNNEHLRFFDESSSDRRIHFIHADNCLIPRRILKEAISYDMERHEFGLVDDYWLSFVVGHYLNVPVWKIQANDVLSFTLSSEDPMISMFQNPAVADERINFYVYHMRAGWPEFPE
jgi:hypothetical protein